MRYDWLHTSLKCVPGHNDSLSKVRIVSRDFELADCVCG